MYRVGHRNIVTSGERLVVPAIPEGNREHRIALAHYILPGRHRWFLRRRIITVNHPRAAAWRAGTPCQYGTEDEAKHQSMKACFTHALRKTCETHPPLPLWWLNMNANAQLYLRHISSLIQAFMFSHHKGSGG